ncbi:MAG TPA: aspartyl protease family protein [Terriglobales bacterium]|nr:aspartyl protease family protein [Terriglobales bacterium]
MKFTLLLGFGLCAAATAQSIDFKLHSGFLIVVKCSIANIQDVAAVIDTGVTETAIDVKLAKRLGLPIKPTRAIFATRESQVLSVSIPNLVLGALRQAMLNGIAIDMSAFKRQVGIDAGVIVGMDVLGQTSFLIDYKAKKITFGAPPPLKYKSPVTISNHLLLVAAEIGQSKLTLQLDTGFNAILIYGNRLPPSQQGPASRSETILGSIEVQLTSQPMKIGDWVGHQVTVAVTQAAPGEENFFDGLLGPQAIGVRRLAFDNEHHLVLWE